MCGQSDSVLQLEDGNVVQACTTSRSIVSRVADNVCDRVVDLVVTRLGQIMLAKAHDEFVALEPCKGETAPRLLQLELQVYILQR